MTSEYNAPSSGSLPPKPIYLAAWNRLGVARLQCLELPRSDHRLEFVARKAEPNGSLAKRQDAHGLAVRCEGPG
jgi:hypothetical protein